MQRLTVLVQRNFSVVGSSWIYANRYEQIASTIGKGKLRLVPQAFDIKDVTIRMHNALMEADVVLCEDYDRTVNLLYSLHNKLRHIEPLAKPTQIVVSDSLGSGNSDELIQLSEHLKFKKEYAKTAGEQLDIDRILRQQNYIRQHNLKQAFRERVNINKERNGFGYVVSLEHQPELRLTDYIHEGFNISFMYDEAGKHLHNIMLQAEEARIPYEILPGPCELISTLSASGFPADRFGIEYFACQQGTEKLDNLLKERKNQNFSLAMMEKRSNLERLLHRASVVFGEKQLAYIVTNLHTVRKELRMPIAECIEQLEKQPIPSKQELAQNCIVIIAPYAMDYNEELKERKFQRSQAVDEINEDEEVATHKLKKLEQKIKSLTDPKSYKVDGVEAIKYLLTVVPEESQVIQLVKQLLRIGDRDAERLVATARLQGTDILHIEHEQLKRRK